MSQVGYLWLGRSVVDFKVLALKNFGSRGLGERVKLVAKLFEFCPATRGGDEELGGVKK